MSELSNFLKEMISLPGLSGYETPVRKIIQERWSKLTDEIRVSPLGSLEAIKKGSSDIQPHKSIMIAAHMDAIGMMVTAVIDGFIRFTEVGGLDPRVLLGQPVIVHGKENLPGVIVQSPDSMIPNHTPGTPVPLEYLWVDVGLAPEKVKDMVKTGDIISYAQESLDLSGETMAGHTMDDRVAVAALTYCLEILKSRIHTWDVWAVATTQEETSFGGAYTSSFGIHPDIGIAIDVCHAKGPGTPEARLSSLGKGLVLGMGPNIHPYIFKSLKKLADEMEIPHTTEVMPHHSGTDAYAIQVTAQGVPSMVISIPLRYMHTPVELVSLKDIQRVGRILAEFITTLKDDYLTGISWDGQP